MLLSTCCFNGTPTSEAFRGLFTALSVSVLCSAEYKELVAKRDRTPEGQERLAAVGDELAFLQLKVERQARRYHRKMHSQRQRELRRSDRGTIVKKMKSAATKNDEIL